MKIQTLHNLAFFGVFVATQAVLAWQLKEHAESLPKPEVRQIHVEDYYAMISPPETENTRLQQIESEQRAREIEYLKQFEEADYRFFNGDAEAYK